MKNRSRATRGHGLLENFLARERASQVDKLIGNVNRKGRILDIGCGKLPFFLKGIEFGEKYGVDRLTTDKGQLTTDKGKIRLIRLDVTKGKLPFKNNFFDVVSMLAVLEHIESTKLQPVLGEVHRVLKPGGRFIITTPAFWTKELLKFMSRVGLVSDVEISEHKNSFYPRQIVEILESAGFSRKKTFWGFFELWANTWAVAQK